MGTMREDALTLACNWAADPAKLNRQARVETLANEILQLVSELIAERIEKKPIWVSTEVVTKRYAATRDEPEECETKEVSYDLDELLLESFTFSFERVLREMVIENIDPEQDIARGLIPKKENIQEIVEELDIEGVFYDTCSSEFEEWAQEQWDK